MTKLLAPIALAAVCAAATLVTNPRSAFALDGPSLSAGDESGPLPCGQGKTIECGLVTNYRCTSWVMQPTVGPGGVGVTYVCAASVTTTTKLYKD